MEKFTPRNGQMVGATFSEFVETTFEIANEGIMSHNPRRFYYLSSVSLEFARAK